MRFRKKVAKALKPVYTAPNDQAALGALAEFSDQWAGKYPDTVASWERAWERNTAVPGVPADAAPGHLHNQLH